MCVLRAHASRMTGRPKITAHIAPTRMRSMRLLIAFSFAISASENSPVEMRGSRSDPGATSGVFCWWRIYDTIEAPT